MEYPPSFCDGKLYVNTQSTGRTSAYDARTGDLLWTRTGGPKASTPAIAGPRLVVTSQDGTVLGLNRENGRTLWKIQTSARVESSPVVLNNVAYFGATDGRLFAVNVPTGSIRWAYNTGGRINSSPSVWGNRICISTYAGSIFCLRRSDGAKLWSTYVKRSVVELRELLLEPLHRRQAPLHGRALRQARRARRYARAGSSGRRTWAG